MKSVMTQIFTACAAGNRRAAFIGFLLGGIVPAMVFFIDHYEVKGDQPLYGQIAAFLVAGGMAFSAKNVFLWAQHAFHDTLKAAGFVILIEGAMIFSGMFWVSVVALLVLIVINGTATSCNLVSDWRSEQEVVRQVKRASRTKTNAIVKQ